MLLNHTTKDMDVRSRRLAIARDRTSPDRVKVCPTPRVMNNNNNIIKPPSIRKVQVVYYLTRNGQLEHPHYMEVTHLANQPLRLRDVMARLTVLRGKGMPSLYSWSCKKSYKNGYVWNDLADNDIISPADGAEFVLKGSELLLQHCSEKLQQLNINNNNSRSQLIQSNATYHLHSKRKQEVEVAKTNMYHEDDQDQDQYQHQEEEDEYGEEEEEDDEEKTSYTSSTTPHSRCSRGVVSTDEQQLEVVNPTESTRRHDSVNSPPSLSSILSDEKPISNNTSKRFEDGDPVVVPGRNSVLLQLISCGNLAVAKAKNVNGQPPGCLKECGGNNNVVVKKSNLHKGVLCKSAVKVAEEEDMINYMSENPRFGNLQSEEKEYFSGSIVESMSKDRVETQPAVLKKSNSYNEERSSKAELVEEEKRKDAAAVKGKCIPLKKCSKKIKK